jgi:flagellar basal-body rod protein FlgB
VNTVPRFDPLTFGEAALKLRSHRHEVLSSNLVNANTPHFKARDIDFKSVLAERLSGKATSDAGVLARTHSGHIAPLSHVQSHSQMYRVGVQPSKDGNTVDPDIERGHFVKNAFFTEAALNFLGSTLRTRMSAVTGQPS